MPSQRSNTTWQRVLTLLEKQHGRPERPAAPPRSPLAQLVLALLGDDTSERKAALALRRLEAECVDFNELRVTRPREFAELAQMVADPVGKAVTISRVLNQLVERTGSVDLDFLTQLPITQARAFLEQLDDVDARTIASVILFALGGNAIPADASVVRVTKRIGLINRALSAERAQAALERMVPAADRFTFYALMVTHGEAVCLVKVTRCEDCALKKVCESSRVRAKRSARSTGAKKKATTKKAKAAKKAVRKTAKNKSAAASKKRSKKAKKKVTTKKKSGSAARKRSKK